MSKHSPHHERWAPSWRRRCKPWWRQRRDSGAGQAPPALTRGGNALLSCSFSCLPRRASLLGILCISLHPSPAALAAPLAAGPVAADPGPCSPALPRPRGACAAALAAAGDLELRGLAGAAPAPRALLALLAGPPLACGGAVLQVMLHNPVAEPGLLGVSSGAGLAAMVAMAVAKGSGSIPAGLRGCRWRPWRRPGGDHAAHPSRTPEHGSAMGGCCCSVAIGILTNAATTWLMYFADDGALRSTGYVLDDGGARLMAASSSPGGGWCCRSPSAGLAGGAALQQLLLGRPRPHLGDERGAHAGAASGAGGLSAHRGGGVACGVIGFVGLVVPTCRGCAAAAIALLPASALGGGAPCCSGPIWWPAPCRRPGSCPSARHHRLCGGAALHSLLQAG